MKLSQKKQQKKLKKYKVKTIKSFAQYRTHHELHHDGDDDVGIMLFILGVFIGVWWIIIHVIDMFFNKLVWWVEPLTIIPVILVVAPTVMLVEFYGKNPLYWWPLVWGTKVEIPEREPFRAYNDELEKSLKEFGPSRVYVEDYTTLKFRTKKDATLFCLKNL
jgi:hypothetical protein